MLSATKKGRTRERTIGVNRLDRDGIGEQEQDTAFVIPLEQGRAPRHLQEPFSTSIRKSGPDWDIDEFVRQVGRVGCDAPLAAGSREASRAKKRSN